MSISIAISGKGGVGKTTVAALCIERLRRIGAGPVLAVDADPNACLDEVLGVHAENTIGGVREEAKAIAQQGLGAGVSKQELLELKIAESLVEAEDFDLIAMGRPEGPGCYCYANNVLKQALQQIADNYPWVVIDNEAGCENLSRRIVSSVDALVLLADPSKRGLDTARRLHLLAEDMGVKHKHRILLVNRLRGQVSPSMQNLAAELGAKLLSLPEDEQLAACAEQGQPINQLPEKHPVFTTIDQLLTITQTPAKALS